MNTAITLLILAVAGFVLLILIDAGCQLYYRMFGPRVLRHRLPPQPIDHGAERMRRDGENQGSHH